MVVYDTTKRLPHLHNTSGGSASGSVLDGHEKYAFDPFAELHVIVAVFSTIQIVPTLMLVSLTLRLMSRHPTSHRSPFLSFLVWLTGKAMSSGRIKKSINFTPHMLLVPHHIRSGLKPSVSTIVLLLRS